MPLNEMLCCSVHMTENLPLLIYMTCADRAEGERIAAALLEKGLIACANVMSPHRALYDWEGEVHNEEETAVIFKSTAGRYAEIEAEIRARHSYDVPGLVAWPVEKGHPDFLAWIRATTG